MIKYLYRNICSPWLPNLFSIWFTSTTFVKPDHFFNWIILFPSKPWGYHHQMQWLISFLNQFSTHNLHFTKAQKHTHAHVLGGTLDRAWTCSSYNCKPVHSNALIEVLNHSCFWGSLKDPIHTGISLHNRPGGIIHSRCCKTPAATSINQSINAKRMRPLHHDPTHKIAYSLCGMPPRMCA